MIPHPSFPRVAIVVAALVSALVASSGAPAAPPCADAILGDWLDNRIDRVYALDCYEAAIDAIPADLRDYTDAADVIARAFQSRSGRRLERGLEGPILADIAHGVPPVDASSSSSVPVPILVLGAMSLMLLGAGGLGYVSRRRREQRGLDS